MAEYYDVDRITNQETGDVFHLRDYSMGSSISTPSPIVSFSDGSPYPMQMQFAIEPVQSGSGNPSPSNVRPITGWTGANIKVANGNDPTATGYEVTTYPITFPSAAGTVYGGTVTVNPDGTGELRVTHGQIASYAGETLPGEWISDRDVYSSGTTPTTGAQVVYELATPITYSLSVPQVFALMNLNHVWADTGKIQSLSYVRNTVPELIRQDTAGQIMAMLRELTWNMLL